MESKDAGCIKEISSHKRRENHDTTTVGRTGA